MAYYNNYSNNSEANTSFNAELFHRQTTMEALRAYIEQNLLDNYELMYRILQSIVALNYAKINTTELDKKLLWLRQNKTLWCIRDDTGNITRINYTNKELLDTHFDHTFRLLNEELVKAGITDKPRDDPAFTMRHFES